LKNLYPNKPGYNTETVPLNLSSDEIISLFEDVLNRGLTLRTQVTGLSMTPFLRGGEILTIKKVGSSPLRIGDLIFFKDRRGFPVLHRIVRKEREKDISIFQTKGDALLSMDDRVFSHDVLGKVCRIEKKLTGGKTKHIDMESFLQRSINHFLAVTGLYRSRVYFAVQKRGIYSSLLSLVKKTLV
jgi:signal peptidase I